MRSAFPILAAGLLVLSSWARAESSAEAILKSAGRDQGLCVVLGCGADKSADLLANLAAKSRMLVHGLAYDAPALERASAAVAAKDVFGQAVAECVALPPLPYVNDLVDVLVVEDPAAAKAKGIAREELLRVLAPEGVLLEWSGTAWTSTVKPRPKGMDDWSHVRHGADDNMVSDDELLRFPIGVRWIDGLPKNTNRWASVRGWVVCGTRCYALSSTEYENLGPPKKSTHYLVARNAFNGLPLWKLNLETTDNGAGLFWQNAGPLVADRERVYAVLKDKPVSVDGVTGKVLATFETKYAPSHLLLSKGVLVAVNWEGKSDSKSPLVNGSLWATWVNKSALGSVDGFDARTGAAKWSLPLAAQTALASGDSVYLIGQTGNPATKQEVLAVDVQTGKERWRIPHDKFGPDADLQLSVAGAGYVILTKRRSGSVLVLAENDGRVTWEDKVEVKADAKLAQTPWVWTPIVDGELWHKNRRRNPLTGQDNGVAPTWLPAQGCTPSAIVGNIVTRSRGCTYTEFPEIGSKDKAKDFTFTAARGACMEGMVPANGMLYTAQNNCQCAPGQVLGFLAFGPNGPLPQAADFAAPRLVVQGPAFGKAGTAQAEAGWGTYRGNPARSGFTPAPLAEKYALAWHTPAGAARTSPLDLAWQARLTPALTAPVVGEGFAAVADPERGRVLAFDAASGKAAWSATLGGRIDSPPTIAQGLCLTGCHDGWVYALKLGDGALAWKARVAPFEKRVVVQGQVESIWPAVGSVLVKDGVAYANAGRGSECDGGVAVVALDLATGKTRWGQGIPPGPQNRNDLLVLDDGGLEWNFVELDPATGAPKAAPAGAKKKYRDPILDAYLFGYGFRMENRPLRVWNQTLTVQAAAPLVAFKSEDLAKEGAKPAPLWTAKMPGGFALNAALLNGDRAVVAGSLNKQGRLWVVALKDGAVLSEVELPAVPVYDGLAASAAGDLIVALQNGEVCGLRKAP
ncbi:MAG: PQQ-binding-like beta-propeller repeat protein [Planctomycetota bacterium]|nr:PQQ-binding-like beta-propeller repeat protein [Planctomycetota bacterium]